MSDDKQKSNNALTHMRGVVVAGVTVILVFFVGLGSWAAIAPLQSAAIAPGVLNVESNRKTVQHLEGGIVAEILVEEGQMVSAGQTLVRLDATQSGASVAQLKNRYYALKALEARLITEREGDEVIDFPNLGDSSEAAEVIAAELGLFEARRNSLEGEQAILRTRISQFQEEISGLRGQIGAQGVQLKLIAEELDAQEELRERKLVGMQRIIELKRERSEITGNRNQQQAAIARIKQNIGEEELKILELRTSRVNEVVQQLTDVQNSLAELEERIVAAKDVLTRTDILAPLDGTIVDLKVHTVGGVVAAGEALMDIVPAQEQLIVDARVNPIDIDSVHNGLTAEVVLTAFSRRTVAPIDGQVVSISADRLTDPRTGVPYYLARVKLAELDEPESPELALSAGMQAEVMIITGEHTALAYLFKPVVRSFYRAMREE